MSSDKGIDGTCPTVRVVSPITDDNSTGYIVINQSDFNPALHELVGEEKKDDAGKGEKGKKKDKADDAGKRDK